MVAIYLFAVNGLLQDSKGLRDRVMYETIPSGNAYLLKVLDCMKANRVINLVYQISMMKSLARYY